jgi:isoquinoline 1-oxidoreductase beta subunit
MKRRTFLLSALGTTGALVIGWGVLPPRSRLGEPADFLDGDDAIALNGWIRIGTDGTPTVAMPRSEMGQGVHTALLMLVAEELDVPLDRMRLEQVHSDSIYGNVAALVDALPFHPLEHDRPQVAAAQWIVAKLAREIALNVTGGSSSVADAWEVMRMAGATARTALVQAAAAAWDVPAAECSAQDGVVVHASGKRAHYGELARRAAAVVPDRVALKPAQDWRLIGTPAPRVDLEAKITGKAIYGIDVRLPGMLYAAVRMSPELGATLAEVDVDAALRLPRVRRVVRLPADAGASEGFAVVADTWWHAEQAARRLAPRWHAGPNARLDDRDIMRSLRRAVETRDGFPFYTRGDADAAFAAAARTLESWYAAPYLAHAQMEPMNCTARVTAAGVDVWASTQVPDFAHAAAARVAAVDPARVTLHVTLLGGGFGRRLDIDPVVQAVRVARQTDGRPVQLLWSREQDTTHDFYRPAQVARLAAALDANGNVSGWRIRSAGDAITPRWGERVYPLLGIDAPDKTTSEGLFDLPYGVANQRIEHVATRSGVPIGSWRSVGHSHNAFFAESFVDELAHAAGKDPYRYRLGLLEAAPRYAAVLKLAAQKADWGGPLADGHARGIALHKSFGSIVAEVAEVSLGDLGAPQVHRVVCAIDCGTAVNPDIIAQQMEGSVVFGLTAALHGRIDIREGRVQQTNYPDYPLLNLAATPAVETYIVPSDLPPRGVGEPGVPPIAPAVANALFALTGKRLRQLPLVL